MKQLLSLALTLLVSVSALAQDQADLSSSYRRLLPLEGGSNFRDVGGYKTADGHTVARGLIFRSGAMTSLTESDMNYLDQFGFKHIVDFRSNDERELFPNQWAKHSNIPVVARDYSILKIMAKIANKPAEPGIDKMAAMYPGLLENIKPQLKQLTEKLLAGETPLVFNCSAGQDRTGTTAALLLTLFDVPHNTVIEDYLLSTDFRDTSKENGGVDLAEAAKTNAFAKFMLKFQEKNPHPERPNSLLTKAGRPYLEYTFDWIKENYGSVEGYFEKELDVSAADIAKLKAMYVQ